MCNLPICEHIAPDITDFPTDPQNPTDVTVINWDDMPLGIEASLAPVGCVYDVGGNLVGKVFISKVTDEETQAETNVLQYLDRATGTIVPYDVNTHGQWSECQKEDAQLVGIENTGFDACHDGTPAFIEVVRNDDGTFNQYIAHYKDGSGTVIDNADPTDIFNCVEATNYAGNTGFDACVSGIPAFVEIIRNEEGAFDRYIAHLKDGSGGTVDPVNPVDIANCPVSPELDAIVANWLPICVDGEQWYVREAEIIDNTDGSTTVTIQYKQGADGAITTTAPIGTITEGYCAGAVGEEVDLIPANFVPLCVFDNGEYTQWYVGQESTYNNQTGDRVDVVVYIQPNGARTTTAPTGAVQVGTCSAPAVIEALPHLVGCLATEASCAVGTNVVNFTAGEYTQFTITANDGNGNYTIVQEMSTVAGATNLVTVLTEASQANARTEQQIIGTATFNYWSGNFSNISQPTTTSVQFDMHLEVGVTDTPPALDTPCVDPVSDSIYQNSATNLRTVYDGIPVGVAQPQSPDSIVFTINTYDAIEATSTQVKQIVWKDVDGTLIEEYRQVGDINTIVPFDPNTQRFVPNCLDNTGGTALELPTTECTSTTGGGTVTATLEATQYNFLPATKTLGADSVYNFETLANTNTNGLIVDGVTDDLVIPDGLSIYIRIADGEGYVRVFDNLGNQYNFASTVTWSYATDPTGSTFLSQLSAELTNALVALGLTPATQIDAVQVNATPTLLSFMLNLIGTDGQTQANFLSYLERANTTIDSFQTLNIEIEADFQFDGSAITSDPTSIVLKMWATIPNGQQAILGAFINGIYGNIPAPYQPIIGNGTLTEYTFVVPVSGTDPVSGAYTLTATDFQSGNVYAWLYYQVSGSYVPGTIEAIDGAVYEVQYESTGSSEPSTALLTVGCNDTTIVNVLEDIRDGQAPSTNLDSGFAFDYVYGGGLYTPSTPANTKQITVTNSSDAIIEVYTNHGSFAVPPKGTDGITIDDNETSLVINYIVNFGGGSPYNGEFLYFNFRTRS